VYVGRPASRYLALARPGQVLAVSGLMPGCLATALSVKPEAYASSSAHSCPDRCGRAASLARGKRLAMQETVRP
jgi:hypothetical protein